MSSTHDPEKKEPQTPGPESTAEESHTTAKQSSITIVDALHAFVDEYKARDDQSSRLHRRNFWLGVTTAVLLFVYTTITALLWCETWQATRIAAEALILDQRPWVFVKEPTLVSLQPNIPITAFVEYINTGRSPAFIVESSVAFRTVDSSGLPVTPEYEASEPQNYILSPVVPHHQRQVTGKGLLPQNVAAVNDGIFQLYIYGYVKYRDSRGDEHKTGFIVLYNPKQQTLDHSPQPNYTYAD
jgi:hypothetical protein